MKQSRRGPRHQVASEAPGPTDPSPVSVSGGCGAASNTQNYLTSCSTLHSAVAPELPLLEEKCRLAMHAACVARA